MKAQFSVDSVESDLQRCGQKPRICLAGQWLGMLLVCAWPFSMVSAQTAAGTVVNKTVTDTDPIVLPKLDAGRVTARVNEKLTTPLEKSTALIQEERGRGLTSVRVSPEFGPAYYLTNTHSTARMLRKDSEQLQVPVWQLFKF